MDRTKTTPWVVGTALLAVVILAGAWLGAISPKLTEARDTRVATEDALAHQDTLRTRLAQLKADHEKIDEYRAELAALRLQIPEDGGLPEYVLELQTLATAHGVTIVAVAPGTPVAAQDPAQQAAPVPDPAAAEGTEASEGAEGTDAAADPATTDGTTDTAPTDGAPGAAAGDDAAAAPGLVTVPVSITVVGTYPGASGFLRDVQTLATRLFHVRALTTATLDEADASGGRPATSTGDVEMTIDGFMLVLPVAPTPPALDEPPAELPPLPQSERNPFAPVA